MKMCIWIQLNPNNVLLELFKTALVDNWLIAYLSYVFCYHQQGSKENWVFLTVINLFTSMKMLFIHEVMLNLHQVSLELFNPAIVDNDEFLLDKSDV